MIYLFKSIIRWLKKVFGLSSLPSPSVDATEEKAQSMHEPLSETELPKAAEADRNHPEESSQPSKPSAQNEDSETEALSKAQTSKPYQKKRPTEEPQNKKKSEGDAKPEESKMIALGEKSRTRKKSVSSNMIEMREEHHENEVKTYEKDKDVRIRSPYIEMSLDEGNIYLVFPKQVLSNYSSSHEKTRYLVELNGRREELTAEVRTENGQDPCVDEAKIALGELLSEFRVVYPECVDKRPYGYTHYDKSVYVFTAIGNEKGRMVYLFDPDSKPNPLPKRNLWILLEENLVIEEGLILSEEKWIWERYQPHLVDASEMTSLEIKERSSKVIKSFVLQKGFQLEGESLVEDDFKKESPLFSGNSLKITSPHVNNQGWRVWVSTKKSSKLICNAWAGDTPLELKLPDDMPSSYGEFQIDICQQGTRVSDETLFFRWLPLKTLDFNRRLSFPTAGQGHAPSRLSISFDDCNRWNVISEEGCPIDLVDNAFLITLPGDIDSTRLLIHQHGEPSTTVVVKVSMPRLRWRTSNSRIWACIQMDVNRKELQSGKELELIVRTNDLFCKYAFEATLQSNDTQLQTSKLIRKGAEYLLLLNQFFDTIKSCDSAVTLSTKIWTDDKEEFLDTVKLITFEVEEKRTNRKERSETHLERVQIKEIPRAEVLRKDGSVRRRLSKGFSKKELNAVGLKITVARRLTIPFDKRRKSCHSWNIEKLASFKKGNK